MTVETNIDGVVMINIKMLCLCQHDGWFQLQRTKSGWIQVKMLLLSSDSAADANDDNQTDGHMVRFWFLRYVHISYLISSDII